METLLEQGSVLMEEEKIQEERVRQKKRILKGSRDRGKGSQEVPFLSFFLGKEPAPCVSFIVWLSLRQVAQKPPFIYPEHLALLRKKRTWKAGNHSMCQSDMAFPLLTLQPCWVHSSQSPQWGITSAGQWGKKGNSASGLCICISLVDSQCTTWLDGKRTFSLRREKPTPSMRPFPPFAFYSRGNSISEGAACTKHKLSTWRQTGPVYSPFPFITFYLLSFLANWKGTKSQF